jgi:branched-subunit amino acid aminotransferase/4-amino-4-deoxychorismate lyase
MTNDAMANAQSMTNEQCQMPNTEDAFPGLLPYWSLDIRLLVTDWSLRHWDIGHLHANRNIANPSREDYTLVMHENVYLNGEIVPAGQAAVSVWDAGFLHGASTFTTMLVRGGRVFRLDRHLNRLFDTVSLLNLRTAATPDSLVEAVGRLIEANGLRTPSVSAGSESRMRITLTPGSVLDVGEAAHGVTLITTEPQAAYIPQWRRDGITVVVAAFKQFAGDPTFGYKTGCYLPRILARQEAAIKGAQEALWFTTNNHLAEACFRNVFLVAEGKVFTPPRDTPVLPGVVREAVIELCGQLKIPCEIDTPLTIRDLLGADEVFLTGSGLGVCPVVRVERHAVGDEKPGDVTKKLMAAYEDLLTRECA